jgi:hypothetical protein
MFWIFGGFLEAMGARLPLPLMFYRKPKKIMTLES